MSINLSAFNAKIFSSFEGKLPMASSRGIKKNKDPFANKTLECFLAIL